MISTNYEMMMDSVETPFPSSSSSNKTSTCVHCCVPLRQSSVHNDHHNNIQQSFSQLLSSSSFNSNNNGTKSLYSIFKLNYLKAFETLDWELEEEENDMEQLTLLCINCNDQLTHLYQLYEAFLQLGKIESSLSKKLNRLDEIIDCHAQKNINCDLIPMNRPNNNNSVCTSSTQTQSLSTNFQYTLSQPQLILSRLTEKDLQLTRTRTTRTDEDDNYSPSNCDEDDEDYNPLSPVIKMGIDDDEGIVCVSDIKVKFLENKEESEEDEIPLKTRMKKDRRRKKNSKVSGKPRGKRQKKEAVTKSVGISSETMEKPKAKNATPKEKVDKKRIPCKTIYNYESLKAKFPNPCWHCDRTDFATLADCLEHTKTEHLSKLTKTWHPITLCERCSKICQGGYAIHLKKCLSVPSGTIMEKQFACTMCSFRGVRQERLDTHMASHNDDRPFACDLCDFTSKAQCTMNAHRKYRHEQLGQEMVQCDECGKSYRNEQALKTHKSNIHSVEGHKKYREHEELFLARRRLATRMRIVQTFCDDCQVDLFSRPGFCNHRRTVHGDLMCNFTCETCGQPFTTRRSLSGHKKTVHTDARPFTCETCGKSFKRAYTLKDHFLHTHTEEGRLKYNEKTRERNRRKKILQSQLANAGMGQGGGDGDW